MKKADKNIDKSILEEVNKLLLADINKEEKEILLVTKIELEKGEYVPRVISELRGKLTPLAIKQKLSKETADFYMLITNEKMMNKNFGAGAAVWANFFNTK